MILAIVPLELRDWEFFIEILVIDIIVRHFSTNDEKIRVAEEFVFLYTVKKQKSNLLLGEMMSGICNIMVLCLGQCLMQG